MDAGTDPSSAIREVVYRLRSAGSLPAERSLLFRRAGNDSRQFRPRAPAPQSGLRDNRFAVRLELLLCWRC